MTQRLETPARIAVVKPCCIGDCVMALPALDSLAAAFPAAELHLAVGPHSRTILESRQCRWRLETISDRITPPAAVRMAVATRRKRLDLVILLERSRLLRAAFDAVARCDTASVAVVEPEIRHESVAYLDILRALGIEPLVTIPTLTPEREDDEAARKLLAPYSRPVLLHPGGAENPGTTMPDKRWPAKRYAALARTLEKDGYDVLFSGGPGDRQLVDSVIDAAGLPPDRSFAGRINLRTAAAVAARTSLFVGGDTGMSHVAAAAGVPVVAIFGPTNPRRYRPLGERVTVLAPTESWELPDIDLRRARHGTLPSTAQVPGDDVLAACQEALRPRIEPA